MIASETKETLDFFLTNTLFNHYPKPTVSKTDGKGIGMIMYMKFREFIQQNIDNLEIPYQPDVKKKYPPKVWEAIHKTVLVQQLQHDQKADTIEAVKNVVYGGDDLGGLDLDNVIDMWLDTMMRNINQVIGSALANSKIREDYEKLVTKNEVECNEPHNEIEDKIVKQGTELPTHTHTVHFIEVTDDNREEFDKFIDVVLRNFDSDVYGELPEEYVIANRGDINAMITELKDVLSEGEKADLVASLKPDKELDSGDFA